MTTETLEKLKLAFLEACIGEPLEPLQENTRLLEDLQLDSLDHIDLMISIDEQFPEITITDEQWATVKTVGDIARLLEAAP